MFPPSPTLSSSTWRRPAVSSLLFSVLLRQQGNGVRSLLLVVVGGGEAEGGADEVGMKKLEMLSSLLGAAPALSLGVSAEVLHSPLPLRLLKESLLTTIFGRADLLHLHNESAPSDPHLRFRLFPRLFFPFSFFHYHSFAPYSSSSTTLHPPGLGLRPYSPPSLTLTRHLQPRFRSPATSNSRTPPTGALSSFFRACPGSVSGRGRERDRDRTSPRPLRSTPRRTYNTLPPPPPRSATFLPPFDSPRARPALPPLPRGLLGTLHLGRARGQSRPAEEGRKVSR